MVGKKKKPRAPPPPPLPAAVKLVSLYALLTACAFAGILLVYAHNNHNPCSYQQSSWWHYCAHLTAALAAQADRLERGMLWCSAPQAAAAALALLLPVRAGIVPAGGGGHRRALAWAALAAATSSHCLYARLHLLFVAADPGGLLYWIVGTAGVLGYAACDLLAFLALILGRRL